MRKRKKEEKFGRILPKLENLFSSFSQIASKVKSSKKLEKNFNQIRYLIVLMHNVYCCEAYF
jgi:hypothetical protein